MMLGTLRIIRVVRPGIHLVSLRMALEVENLNNSIPNCLALKRFRNRDAFKMSRLSPTDQPSIELLYPDNSGLSNIFLGYNFRIMLKSLAILALTTVCMSGAQTTPQNSPKTGVAKQGTTKAGSNQPASDKPSQHSPLSATAYVEAPRPADQEKSNAEQEGIEIQRKLEWFTGVLAVVGVLQVLTMIWQAWLLKATRERIARQTDLMKRNNVVALAAAKAAEQNAKAARDSVQLIISKERARLDVDARLTQLTAESEGDELRHLIATLKVRIIGTSRAHIRRTHGDLITKLPDEAPREPDYYRLDLPDQFLDPSDEAIPVKIYFFPDSITIQAFAEHLEQAKFSLHLFGFIEYESLGLCWRRDFGYDWMPVSHHSPFDDGEEIEVIDNSEMPEKHRIGIWILAAKRGAEPARVPHKLQAVS